MNPENCRFTKEHEWIGAEGDLYVVGISDFAQDQLGDVTFVDLPEKGRTVAQFEETAAVESVKAASDIYAPAGGTIAEVNDALDAQPELINQEPFGGGWIFKLSGVDAAELDALMDYAAYQEYLKTVEEH